MATVPLNDGENLLPGKFEIRDVDLFDGGPLVRLVGVARYQKPPSIPLGTPRPETTVEIHMDQAAAIELAAKISDLARSMDWRLPPGVLVLA